MTNLLEKEFKILDHGFLRVIDFMGGDDAIVQSARVSYGSGTKTVNTDKGLINYLVKHKHTSPLEMCEIKLHLKMPIFVARQWIRHRTASVNEYSARYSILSNDYYIPELSRIQKQSKDNKQGSGEALSPDIAQKVRDLLTEGAEKCYDDYEFFLSEDVNFARELARMNLNLNYYTEFYWKIDLHNFLHFINLRAHPHAQYEIRVYAEKMLEIARAWCPFATEAFENYVMNAKTFSQGQIEVIKRMISGEVVDQETSGLSKRDFNELRTLDPHLDINNNLKKAISIIESDLNSRELDLSELGLTTQDLIYLFNIEKYKEFFREVRGLYLDKNQIKEIKDNTFNGLKKLEELSLFNNQIEKIEKGAFNGLENLEDLILRLNHIKEIKNNAFKGLKNLRKLNLMKNQITEIEKNAFNGLENLEDLNLSRNGISIIEKGAFKSLEKLLELELSSNGIMEIKELPKELLESKTAIYI